MKSIVSQVLNRVDQVRLNELASSAQSDAFAATSLEAGSMIVLGHIVPTIDELVYCLSLTVPDPEDFSY